ncbi:antigen 5 like allergen Cul n 1-like [Uranotaenia lowii]|uniref:antigen 5 like allergen Cul n 1-like n=1 Tax=Uranotaenia lowii TaxID=190385 RepID=UPI00247A5375|nr:antigen 5 like allergen Cul n 1-like [Uranotaenia lowii]
MSSLTFLLPVLVSMMIGAIGGTDYCALQATLCEWNVKQEHIGCNPETSFGPACGSDREFFELDPSMQQAIVSKHNQLRSQIATGSLPGFPPAVRMGTMVWDDELALLASYLARTCIFKHDDCRNTERFDAAGQNLRIASQSVGNTSEIVGMMEDGIQSWFDEYKITPIQYINSYPENYNGPHIGHFTQIVADRANRVGCAIVRFFEAPWHNFLFVCDYSVSNILSEPIYRSGPMASECTTGENPNYPGLCNEGEEIKPTFYYNYRK